MKASGREPEPRFELPFDQFQRYSVASELLRSLGVPAGSRVLEVGGAPGPLEAFMPEFSLVVSDVVGAQGGRYLLADGAALPFPDDSFTVVLALDVLEHVPATARSSFLSEAQRVAGDLVLLSAPFADPQLELAEEALNEFIRARFQGNFPTLDEHAAHGLPELDATVRAMGAGNWATTVLPSGYLPHWLAGMLVHHELLATGVPSLPKLHAYYNEVISPLDCREPAYRHVVLASGTRPAAELARAVDGLRSEGDSAVGSAALSSIASAILTQRLEAVGRAAEVEQELERARTNVAGLERVIADRDAHLHELRRVVDQIRVERDRAASAERAAILAERSAVGAERAAVSRARMLGIPYAFRRIRGRLVKKESDR